MEIILDIETASLTDNREDALSPINGRVIAIGMKFLKEELIIMEEDEKLLILKFWDKIRELHKKFSSVRYVGYNIRDFDFYFMINRSLHHNLEIVRPNSTSFIDLREHLTLFRTYGKSGKLNDYAKLIGVEGKYKDFKGGDMPLLWKQKKYEEVREYLRQDLFITNQLFERCKNIGLIYEN
ncbi:MAG: ribonuclease H-like domain-containing protein [Candidatus Woesearchaeota archaeon]